MKAKVSPSKTSTFSKASSRTSLKSGRNQTSVLDAPIEQPPKYFGPKDLPHHGPKCQFVFPPKKDGLAIYEYPNSFFKYIGEWKNGKKHGKGKLMIGQNSYYEGDFLEGEISGSGDRYFPNGSHYHGSFLNGEFNGKGEFTNANGEKYVGEFKDNRRNGEGVLTYADGTTYTGSFLNHKRDGHGDYTDIEGNHYNGEWKENRIEGKGLMEYSNGDIYEGSFLDGKKAGKGTIKWASTGLQYTGDWSNDTNAYNPTEIAVSDLPPITPGTSLSGIVISIVGGDGECGRKLRITIEIGRVDPNASLKKTTKTKKQEPIEHVPKFLVLNTETEETFLDLSVENGSAVVPPISIPPDAEQTTYTLLVIDLSEDNPLPQNMVDFQFVSSPQQLASDKTSAKGKVSRKGASSRASDKRPNPKK